MIERVIRIFWYVNINISFRTKNSRSRQCEQVNSERTCSHFSGSWLKAKKRISSLQNSNVSEWYLKILARCFLRLLFDASWHEFLLTNHWKLFCSLIFLQIETDRTVSKRDASRPCIACSLQVWTVQQRSRFWGLSLTKFLSLHAQIQEYFS